MSPEEARSSIEAASGRYGDLSYLSEGGMQYVFRGFDVALQRWVVLKTPKSGVVDRRFRRGG